MNEYDFSNTKRTTMYEIKIDNEFYKDFDENRELDFIEKVFGRRKSEFESIMLEYSSQLEKKLVQEIDDYIMKICIRKGIGA